MINLCIPTSINCKDFTIDDVEWIVSNKEEFIVPYLAMKDEYPFPSLSIQLYDWEVYKDDTYISISMLINLDNIDEFSLRVNEGYYSNTNERIIDGDGFLDIKTDNWSIRQAISDIKEKQLPLHNRVQNINADDYPYMVENEEQDEDY